MNRMQMLEWVQMLCFCVVDMQLYLDTHPEDEEAFCYFKEVVEMYEKAKQKFEENYGPLTATSSAMHGQWTWSDMPLPWEGVR